MMKISITAYLVVLFTNFIYSTDRVIATVPVGLTPQGMAITPNGRYVYVANYNYNSIPNQGSVSVIRVSNNQVVKTITDASLDAGPYSITINASGTVAYAVNDSALSVIDISTNTVTAVINGFVEAAAMVISADGNTGYVADSGAAVLYLINLNNNTVSGSINVGTAPTGLAITPDGNFVYATNVFDSNPGTGTVSIVRTSDNTVTGTITGFSNPNGIVITSDGKLAYVSNASNNTVSVINLSSNKIVASINVGLNPWFLSITPDDRYVYVAENGTQNPGIVNIIDTCTNKVMCVYLEVGSQPFGVSITPDGQYVYVSNFGSNTVSVANIVDRMWLPLSDVCCNY